MLPSGFVGGFLYPFQFMDFMEEVSIDFAFKKFRPESCVFVISVDGEGKPNGMVAGWNMACASEPPMFAVSLWKGGNTNQLIRKSGEFVVAVPNKELEKEVEFFGTTHGNHVDKFKETGIETAKARHVKPPLIRKATINLECKLEKEVQAGDHIIFIGRVLAAHVNQEKKVLLNMGKKGGKRIFREF